MTNVNMNFDEYVPVFLYSHAAFAEWNEKCKVGNPKISGEISEDNQYSSLINVNDFFLKVNKNMIVVDPIPHGLLCVSGHEMDHLFPWVILTEGSNAFIKTNSKEYYKKLDDLGLSVDNINVFRQLYQNTKMYYPGDYINNLRIAFDENDGIVPWNIRIPNTDDSGELFKTIQGSWTRQYNTLRNDQCIYLKDVLKKIQSEFKNKKIMVYLISCREQPDYNYIFGDGSNDFLNELLIKQNEVLNTGMNNVNNLRPGTITLRQTRTQLKKETAFAPNEKNPGVMEELQQITNTAVKKRKREDNKKSKTRQKRIKTLRKGSRGYKKRTIKSKSKGRSMSRSRSKGRSMSKNKGRSMSRSNSGSRVV